METEKKGRVRFCYMPSTVNEQDVHEQLTRDPGRAAAIVVHDEAIVPHLLNSGLLMAEQIRILEGNLRAKSLELVAERQATKAIADENVRLRNEVASLREDLRIANSKKAKKR